MAPPAAPAPQGTDRMARKEWTHVSCPPPPRGVSAALAPDPGEHEVMADITSGTSLDIPTTPRCDKPYCVRAWVTQRVAPAGARAWGGGHDTAQALSSPLPRGPRPSPALALTLPKCPL